MKRSNVLIGLLISIILFCSLSAWSRTITAEYNSGNGSVDYFVVNPNTVFLGTYSDSDTDAVFQHRGQQVSTISTVTITTSQAVGLRIWKNGDRVVVYDDATTPNVVQTTINGTPSGSTITLTDSAAAVTGTNKWISKNLIADPNMEHSNANAYTAGDAATTLAKDTTTVKFDTRSLKITNGDATQGFVRQTITTAAGEDYRFHGWFRTPATPNGASQLVDVDTTAALGITVTQAGATVEATWYEIDFTFEAADTSTTIDWGSGSVTNAEIGYWDNVTIQKNLINNPGMEGTYVSGVAPGWIKYGSTGTMTEENTIIHSGSKSQKIVSPSDNIGYVYASVPVVANKYYTITAYVRTTDGKLLFKNAGDTVQYFQKIIQSASSFAVVKHTFTATATENALVLIGTGAGSTTVYIDAISLIELDQDDPTTTGVTTPSTSASSFGTGKWSDSLGAFINDGRDTLSYPNTNIIADRGTIAFWAKINSPYTAGENKVLLDARGADDNNRVKVFYQASDDKFTVFLNGANRIQSSAQVNNNNFFSWHHFVFAYDFVSDRYTFFMDGASVGTDTTALSPFSLGANLIYIGSNYDATLQGDSFFDDVFFFKRELTLNEVKRLYAFPRSANLRSLTGGW